ncbi:MAG: dehydratase [Solirubrobacterales bacterium]|nr:dehydratase [Solirubrobacterales bacterium]
MTSPTRFARETPSVVDWSAPFEALAEGLAFTSRGRTITETDVVQFAALTGDFHPLHTDAVFAAEGPFGARIAHGMLTISYAVGLVPLDPRRVLALRRITDVVFKRPVHLGQTIHVEGSVTGLKGVSDEAGIVSFSWRIKDAQGTLLTRATIDVLWATDAPAVTPQADADPGQPAAPPTPPMAFGQELHPAGSFVPVPL